MIDTAESQDEVFTFLERSSTHGGADVRRIDTHAAVVFLAGARAYKVKRAVRFPFLDFSTLEKRRNACTAEIEANRPFAPGLYRRVVTDVTLHDGHVADAWGYFYNAPLGRAPRIESGDYLEYLKVK